MEEKIEEWSKYVDNIEFSDTQYVKIGSGGKKLIVSFAHHIGWFAQKTSFFKYRASRDEDVDLLFIRDAAKRWYLGELPGIGSCFQDTLNFLRQEFNKYETVVLTGFSMGGYAAILFGSLLNVNAVISFWPQVDLNYCIHHIQLLIEDDKTSESKRSAIIMRFHRELTSIRESYSGAYKHFSNISNNLNNDCKYFVAYQPPTSIFEDILHGAYHIDLIKNHPSVQTTTADKKKICDYFDSVFDL